MTAAAVVVATLLIALGLMATTTRRISRARAVAATSTGAAVLLASLASAPVASTLVQPSIAGTFTPVALGAAAITIIGLRPPTAISGVGALLAGPVRLLFDDPFHDPACETACDPNPFALWPQPSVASVLTIVGYAVLTLGLIASGAAGGRGLWVVPLGFVAAALWSDAPAEWLVAAALLACVLFGWDLGRALGGDRRLMDLIEAMAWEGDAEVALTRIDPQIRVAYRIDSATTLVDREGSPLAYASDGLDVVGPDGLIAQLQHPGSVGFTRAAVDLIRGPARLGLENLRLSAESAARAIEIASSTQRLVLTADAERRRLERDLHDGAQQGLVNLGLQLRLEAATTSLDGPSLDLMVADLQRIAAEVRAIAHGIHAASLDDDGLLHALRLLANRTPVPLAVITAPDRPVVAVLAAATYAAVEDVCMVAGGPVDVSVVDLDGAIKVAMIINDAGWGATDGPHPLDEVTSLERSADRFRALGGSLQAEPTSSGTKVTGFLPRQPT